jgi:hypothetical protein
VPEIPDADRFRETLQPRCDVHSIAVDLRALDHHVAEVHADAKLHSALGCEAGVLSLESALDIDGAIHRLDHACELREHTVSSRVHEALVMLFDRGID